jgi:hypothetical protein
MLATRINRPLKVVVLAATLAALAAPTAQAKLDSWGYDLVHQSAQSVPLITEHSAGQSGTSQPTAAQSGALSAAASVSAAASNGFQWRDAGVGAGVAFAAMLLAVGVATVIQRRGRRRLAGF